MSRRDQPFEKPGVSDLDAERLASWLHSHIEGFDTLRHVDKFSGGQSNPTYRLQDAHRSYVLRRKPFGSLLPSAHAVEREFQLISALSPTGFPVPRPYALCDDATVIGSPFYVMEMVVGRTFWDGGLPEQSPDARREIYQSMIATLAALHCIRPDDVGLATYGPPGNYFERQVRRWTKQYRAAETVRVPEIENLIAWLPSTVPTQERISIIHGDYRIDNLIYAVDSNEVAAVLDWELSTLGDPLADFAYLAMNWAMPAHDRPSQLLGLDLATLGIPDLDEATRQYCEATERTGLPNLNWYFAYNLFRLAGIVQGIKKRVLDGNASSADAADVASRVTPLARQAWEFARQAGAKA